MTTPNPSDNQSVESNTNQKESDEKELRNYFISSSIKFGCDPEEFDIGSKWPRRYLAARKATTLTNKKLSDKSIETYLSPLREWTNFVHDHNETILTADFDLFIDYLVYGIELGRRTNTIMVRVTAINELYKHIVLKEDQDPGISPVEIDEIERVAIDDLTVNGLDRTYLSKEKVQKLFENMDRERDRLMTITGVETGFRNSDIREIRMIDSDLDEPEIRAHNPKYGDSYTVPISEELALELELWIDNGREGLLGTNESQYLFPSERGGMIESNDTFAGIIRDAANRADINGILGKTEYETKYMKTDRIEKVWYEVVPHVLRHTFITILEKENVPLEYRQLLANHKSPETTKIYSHGKKEILENAIEDIKFT